MKLLFIRHGESFANTEGRLQGQMDSPLSDRGRQQARALARRLVHECWPVSSIHSSDLCRAADTAGILGAALGAPVLLDDWSALSGCPLSSKVPGTMLCHGTGYCL